MQEAQGTHSLSFSLHYLMIERLFEDGRGKRRKTFSKNAVSEKDTFVMYQYIYFYILFLCIDGKVCLVRLDRLARLVRLQTDYFHLFLRQQTYKRKPSVCAISR